jgi:dTDP-4-dehydrorhamnose reductase
VTSQRKVLVTGVNGQVGTALLAAVPEHVKVLALTRAQLDIGERDSVSRVVAEFRPDVIINAAAYTAVDRAESDADAAFRVNALGPAHLAEAAADAGTTRLIHLSTDFVFDGRGSTPYRPEDEPAPLGVYGKSKAEGEREVRRLAPGCSCVIRTSWVYSSTGQNFVKTMLRLMRERGQVRVVSDQVGTPTAAASLAAALWRLVDRDDVTGIRNWTDAGVASWYDFAMAIAEEGTAAGFMVVCPKVTPIVTADYPLPAKRPAYSVLDSQAAWAELGIEPTHWRVRLRQVLREFAGA